MKRVMIVMGTRPEAIKLCPPVRELKKRGRYEVLVCSTGQHRAMLESALAAFSVTPDFKLDVMRSGQTLSDATAAILQDCGRLFAEKRPDMVLVQGDTTTAFAAGLAAFHQGIPVGHVEAGLRTYHIRSPFPEELHRQAISLFADYHFAPTVAAKRNLVREGKPEARIFITGNTVVDALRFSLTEAGMTPQWRLQPNTRLLLFTAHRRESWGEPLRGMLRALRRLVEEFPDVIAVFPVHPNPAVREAADEILRGAERIRMIEPPDVVSFHHLLAHCDLVMTDSGGIQEEAVALGIPTVVMRYSSERGEGMRMGVLRLAGQGEEGIIALTERLLAPNSEEYLAMKKPSAVYGDGNASARIADALEKILGF